MSGPPPFIEALVEQPSNAGSIVLGRHWAMAFRRSRREGSPDMACVCLSSKRIEFNVAYDGQLDTGKFVGTAWGRDEQFCGNLDFLMRCFFCSKNSMTGTARSNFRPLPVCPAGTQDLKLVTPSPTQPLPCPACLAGSQVSQWGIMFHRAKLSGPVGQANRGGLRFVPAV